MLDNLLGNALKYTPVGGDIKIRIIVEGDQLLFQISDTGPGIPPADQPHIFEKFYRGSNVSVKVTGSGLGLAIVKSIVEAHHGRIWVDSVYGKGSTFVVVLPLIKAA
jgi:two-component system NtrC family sensor kinase